MKAQRNHIITSILLILSIQFSFAQKGEKYEISRAKSLVKWNAKKAVGEHNGVILVKEGYVLLEGEKVTGGTVFIDMNSIRNLDLDDEASKTKLVNHLKSDDFFSSKKFPTSIFKIYKIKPLEGSEDFTHTVEGSLSIKGYTNPLSFPVKIEFKKEKVFIEGATDVDRTLYNIKYGSGKFFEDLGDRLIEDYFNINFKIAAEVPQKN